jgi:hypothetical protein
MRLMLAAIALVSLVDCTGNFCSRSVIVPSSKFGTCNVNELSGVVDGGIPIIAFADVTTCEQAESQSCDSSDDSIINSNIDCLSNINKNLPSCAAGQELTWPAQYFQEGCPGNGTPSTTCTNAVGLTP